MPKHNYIPEFLATSIVTSFGNHWQAMIREIFEGYASTTKGIDIEFIDQVDGRRKYCQIKSGPNTINKDDVTTIINHFRAVKNLARTNGKPIALDELVIGVVYGEPADLSFHYRKLDEDHPVFIGADFWHRITGKKDFYKKLISALAKVSEEVNGHESMIRALNKLANEIKQSPQFK